MSGRKKLHRRPEGDKKLSLLKPTGESTMNAYVSQFKWNIKDIFELLQDHLRSPDFAALLDVRTVISLGLVCRTFHQIFDRSYLQLVIRLGNLEPALRWLYWMHMAPCAEYSYFR